MLIVLLRCHTMPTPRLCTAAVCAVLVTSLAGVGAGSAAADPDPAAGTAAKTPPKVLTSSGMYGKRYCEYLVVKGQVPDLTGTVWNTYGLNTCPKALWEASDAKRIAAEQGALTVLLNGPRFWLIDRVKLTNPGPIHDFFGLRMREATAFQVPIHDGVPGQPPYGEVTVNRHTSFIWSRKHRVQELLAPGGRIYTMQAYSHIVDETLRLGDLPALGSRLKLPDGWRFRVRTLKKDLVLRTTTKATIVQDELQNTYQRSR